MPIRTPFESVTGSARAILPLEDLDRGLLGVGGLERDEPPIHQVRHVLGQRCQENFADPDVVDEQAPLVHDVDDIQGFAVPPVCAHEVQHFLDGPALAYGDVVRRHQAADRAGLVAEQRDRFDPFLRRQQRQQVLRDVGRQLSEEQRPIVVRHVVEHGGDVLLPHGFHQRFLRRGREVFEDVGGEFARQHSECEDLVARLEVLHRLGDLDRPEAGELVAKPREIRRFDRALYF